MQVKIFWEGVLVPPSKS